MILFWRPQTQNCKCCVCNRSNIKQHRKKKIYEGLIYETSVPVWVHIWGQIWTPVFMIRTVMWVMGCGGELGRPQWHRRTEAWAKATWCHRAGQGVFQSPLRSHPQADESHVPWRPGRGMLRVSVLEISVPAGIVIWGRVLVVLRKAIKVTGVSRACNLIGTWVEEMGC